MHTESHIASRTQLVPSDRRKAIRFDVRINANVSYNGYLRSSVITNLSFFGMRLQTELGLMPGDRVKVTTVNGRAYSGKVIWSVYPRAGIALDERLELNDPLIEKYVGVDKILSGALLDPLIV